MDFKISDDNDDNDVVIVNGESEASIVSEESFRQFVNGKNPDNDADVVLNLVGKGEKERVQKINEFVLNRIIAARDCKPPHELQWIISHAAKTLDWLAHQAKLKLNDSDNNAMGLYKKAKQLYVLQELADHATACNQSVDVKVVGSILDSDKPRFTSRLFHAICEEIQKPQPKFDFEYKAGRKTETIRYDDAVGLRAINTLKHKRIVIQKAAKAAKRNLTEAESAQIAEIGAKITEIWSDFFNGAKDIVGAAEELFPEVVGTGRTTTSAVFKGVCTMDSINFGAFTL